MNCHCPDRKYSCTRRTLTEQRQIFGFICLISQTAKLMTNPTKPTNNATNSTMIKGSRLTSVLHHAGTLLKFVYPSGDGKPQIAVSVPGPQMSSPSAKKNTTRKIRVNRDSRLLNMSLCLYGCQPLRHQRVIHRKCR